MGCPDANVIAELSVGALGGDDRAHVEAHVASCDECRAVVVRLQRSSLLSENTVEEIPRGARFGRFTIEERIGAGAMGAVYAAADPSLSRKVALKVLHASGNQQRLVAEARAMARLAHPNVVPVLDIGEQDGRVFLAMEFVDGRTLQDWLAEPRSVKAILAVLVEAGRGLSASHGAGLTHRDFKPANVLVGRDGRVRVTDFGLARADAAPPTGSEIARSTESAGTPAYMAPEQFRGEAVGPASDQFSFCVVAWEALFGQLPFDPGQPPNIRTLAESVLAGRIRNPSDARGVRPWLRRILERGLQPDSEQRFPSLDELLDALQRDPEARRRRVALSAAAGFAVAALSATGFHFVQERRQLCQGAEAQLAGIWDAARKQEIERGFAGSPLPFAAHAWKSVSSLLDGYARDWTAMRTDACLATRVRREQSEEVLDLRMSCLQQRRAGLEAAADLLAHADAKVVQRAVQIASGLSPVRGCADVDALKAPLKPPPDPAARAAVESVRAQVARARVLEDGGNYAEGLKRAQAAVLAARATHYPPVEAEALERLAGLQLVSEIRDKTVEKNFEDAFYAAESSRHDRVAASSAAFLVSLVSEGGAKRQPDLDRWVRSARAVLSRSGNDYMNEAILEDSLGLMASDQARYEEALAKHRLALSLMEKAVGTTHRSSLAIHDHLGDVLSSLGRYDEALAEHRLVGKIVDETRGPDHPDSGQCHNNMATILSNQGKYDEALTASRHALAIWLKTFGPDHSLVAVAHVNVAIALHGKGQYDEAIAEHRLALASWQKANGPDDPDVANCRNNIATVYLDQGRHAEALVELRAARASWEKSLPPEHPWLLGARVNIGDVLRRQGKFREALAEQEAAHQQLVKTLGADHPSTAIALAGVGQTHLGLHQAQLAADELSRALKVIEARMPNPALLGEFRFWTARALDDSGQRAQAVALALKARDNYRTLDGAGREKQRAEIDAWLRTRTARPH